MSSASLTKRSLGGPLPVLGPSIVLLLLVVVESGHAITVTTEDITCPLCGNTFPATSLVSMGSYVFDRDSKYDMVFVPGSEGWWLWMCPKCGYAQISSEFTEVSGQDAERLRSIYKCAPLSQSADSISLSTKLEGVIRTNELLGKDSDFWCWFNRVAIYHYRSLAPDKARLYAQKEIPLLQNMEHPDQKSRKQTLYLLGEYSRMLGREEDAQNYFAEALELKLQSDSIKDFVFVAAFGFVVVAFMWTAMRRKLVLKVTLTAAMLVFLIWAFTLCWRLYDDLKVDNAYYDAIIHDRMSLISQSR